MAVQQRTYTDPTAQIFQMFQNLGGSKTTTTGNSAGVAGLREILNQQLGMTTPEGMQQLIANIFEQGGKAVPQIAMQFGQAAGARVSNNSGIKLANADLQKQIAGKAVEAILQAQGAAARTAGELARASQTQTQKPQFSAMQLLPFLPGLAKKFGVSKAIDDFNLDKFMGSLGFGGGVSSGVDAGISPSAFDSGGADFWDMGSVDTLGDFGGGVMLDGMGGGTFGFVDPDVASGIDLGSFDFGSAGADAGSDFFGDFDFGFADGGRVDANKLRSMANKKPKGYANGGSVTAGPAFDITTPSGSTVRGITYNGSDSLIPILTAVLGRGAQGQQSARDAPESMRPSTNGRDAAGPGVSVPSVVGTPSENAAAVNGMIGLAIGQALGVPSSVVGMAMSALGIPNSSMSPMAQLSHLVQSMVTGGIGGNTDGLSPDSVAAATGISGVNSGGLAGLGVSLGLGPDGGMGMSAADAAANSGIGEGVGMGIGPSVDGLGGASSGGPGVGSTGGTDGVGDAAAAGVGGGGFQKGGAVDGPGTGTSDSIPVKVSDGEFIVNAEGAEMFLPVLEMMNAMGLQKRVGGTSAKKAQAPLAR